MVLSSLWLIWDSYLLGEHSRKPKLCLPLCKPQDLTVAGQSSVSVYVGLVACCAVLIDEVLVDVSSISTAQHATSPT